MKEYVIEKMDTRLRYHDLDGDQIPILFIHGLGCSSSFDYPQVATAKELKAHRKLLVDLLGSGYSDKPADFSYTIDEHAQYLERFIHFMKLKECILYAHSMGGTIAIELANRVGSIAKGIIISEGNLDSGGGFYSQQIATYSEQDYVSFGHQKMIAESLNKSNRNWAMGLSVSLPEAIYREAVSLVTGTSPSWREIFYSLKCARLYIFGELSLPNPDFEKIKEHNIKIEIVKNAGHSMAWENPKGLAIAINKGIAQSTV